MKKTLSAFGAGMLAVSLFLGGCSKKEETGQEAENNTPQETEEASKPILGGWQANDSYSQLLGDEELQIFSKASEQLTGVGYDPVTVVATQTAAGTNYAYLCYGQTVTAEPSGGFYIVTVSNDLDGNAKIDNIQMIDPNDLHISDKPNEAMLGSWQIRGSGKPGATSEEAEAALQDAMMRDGLIVMPIVLLGQQVVNGTNYMFLVYADGGLNILTVNAGSDGTAQVSSNLPLDLLYYVTPQD